MADNVSNLTFNGDPLSVAGVPLASYTGNLNVDYDTGVVTGTLSTEVLSTLQVQNYTNYSLSLDNGTGQYTIVGTSPSVTGSITLTYAGQDPSAINSSASIAGLPLLAGFAGPVVAETICFVAGTMIQTESGEMAVERLNVGDKVLTSSGQLRPIVWLGHRDLECSDDDHGRNAWPVCIRRNALGDGKPHRDLYVSPQHSIAVSFLEEVLIPAKYLVNGGSIVREARDDVSYWHVELETHDLILAEGLAAETFLDTQGRRFFDNGAAAGVTPLKTHDDFCRPLVLDGPIIAAVRAQIERRMTKLGWYLDLCPDLHILADGTPIYPLRVEYIARFVVPAGTRDIRVISRTFIPSEVEADSGDGRSLGVPLKKISVIDGIVDASLPLAEQSLDSGFWHYQQDAALGWRWTSGEVVLDPTLWAHCHDAFFLRLELATERGHFRTWTRLHASADVVHLKDFKAQAA